MIHVLIVGLGIKSVKFLGVGDYIFPPGMFIMMIVGISCGGVPEGINSRGVFGSDTERWNEFHADWREG
jgi:hypothetical protein